MGAGTIANFGDLLEPDHLQIFLAAKARAEERSQISELFRRVSSSKPWETFSSVGDLGDLEDFTVNPQLQYDEISQLYDKKLTYIEKALGYLVSARLFRDDRTGTIKSRPKALGTSAIITREKDGFAILNDAFSAEPTDGDGVELCASDRPYSPDSAATWSNEGTDELSVTSVGATRILMRAFKNDREDLGSTEPDRLIVPPNKEEKAWEINASILKPDTADNTKNFHYGRWDIKVGEYLTDTDNWFMGDSEKMTNDIDGKLLFVDRIPATFARDDDFDTKEAKFSVFLAYVFGWATPVDYIYGHEVS